MADGKDETSVLAPEDRKVVVNGELSTSCRDKEASSHPEQPQKLCSAKKVTDLNGVTIRTQSCQSTPGSENHLTSDDSSQSKFDPSITNMSALEEKQSSEQAGPADASEKRLSISYVGYESELQMQPIMALITKDLSEPYSIYTYRYFIHNWPKLCFLAMDGEKCIGAIVCKLDMHKNMIRRGYIAMLAVEKEYRRHKIGSNLVVRAIKAMIEDSCDEVVLETEVSNTAALRLYENLGFVRDKRLFRYYLNGVDALRLKLWLR